MFRRLLLLTMVCTVAAAGVARSTTVIPPTFDALVSSAATIFVGEVMNVRSEWETTRNGRTIITLVTFRVEDVWKGDLGAVTQLEFLGGEIGDLGMRVELGGKGATEADLPPEERRQRMWWGKSFANFTETFDAFGLVDHLRALPENHEGLGKWVELPDHLN